MCAQFKIPKNVRDIANKYGADLRSSAEAIDFRTHIFPKYSCPVVALRDGKRVVDFFSWGLLPRWARDTTLLKKYDTFNAKAETLTEKQTYKKPFEESHRCVIPALSFVEWKKPEKEGGKKTPVSIGLSGSEFIPIAGLWDVTDLVPKFETFTMITTTPNDFMKPLHHRMPVVLDSAAVDAWLNPDTSPEDALKLLKPFSGDLAFVGK